MTSESGTSLGSYYVTVSAFGPSLDGQPKSVVGASSWRGTFIDIGEPSEPITTNVYLRPDGSWLYEDGEGNPL